MIYRFYFWTYLNLPKKYCIQNIFSKLEIPVTFLLLLLPYLSLVKFWKFMNWLKNVRLIQTKIALQDVWNILAFVDDSRHFRRLQNHFEKKKKNVSKQKKHQGQFIVGVTHFFHNGSPKLSSKLFCCQKNTKWYTSTWFIVIKVELLS